MADETHEFTGKTVDDAVAEALSTLKVNRSEVAVEVLSKGSRGIFGIGSEPARVRITMEPQSSTKTVAPTQATIESRFGAATATPSEEVVAETETVDTVGGFDEEADESWDRDKKSVEDEEADTTPEAVDEEPRREPAAISDDELADMASEMLSEIVRLMGFTATVETSWQEPDEDDGSGPFLLLDIEGDDLGALIGRRGETLASLQYLVRLMVNQRIKQWRSIVVDVEKYKERREKQLKQLALRMADQVTDSGRATALEPMPPNERRLVHLALRDHPTVYTQSSGEGDRRKVNIVPRDTAE